MPSKLVHVEVENGLPVRIFRTKAWRDLPEERIATMLRSEAVGSIRERVYNRVRGENGAECERCGRSISWTTMEMNEKRPKGAGGGKTGGEVSMENCEALCRSCHQTGPDAAHKDRRWQTSKIKSDGDVNEC